MPSSPDVVPIQFVVKLDVDIPNLTLLIGALCTTIFSIVGNAIPGLVIATTVQAAEIRVYLWSAKVCARGTDICASMDRGELDASFHGFCSHQLRAAEAGGILSCLTAGALCIFAVILLVRTTRLPPFFAICACIVVAVVQLATFALYVTLKSQRCMDLEFSKDYRAAPFMFLAGLIVSTLQIALLVWYSFFFQGGRNSNQPDADQQTAPNHGPTPPSVVVVASSDTDNNPLHMPPAASLE